VENGTIEQEGFVNQPFRVFGAFRSFGILQANTCEACSRC